MNSTLLSSSLTFVFIFTGRLITGGRDGRLRIWNYNNGHCLRTLEKSKVSTDSRTERECLCEKYCFELLALESCASLTVAKSDSFDSLFEKLNASTFVSKSY